MNNAAYVDVNLQPSFIDGTKGRLFCLYAQPESTQKEVFLFLPSFAEEMNRCRVMVAMQARMLGKRGYGCLLLDYYGTGDSEGDFAEATWEQWSRDVLSACEWLRTQGYYRIVLWGVRVGGLLAAELANQEPEYFSRVVLWQPVLDSRSFMTQFFRIRLAMLMDRGEPKETTLEMRRHLQQGNSLEIAGYTITPQFFEALDAKNLTTYQSIETPVDWFEIVTDENGELSLGSQKLLAMWRQHGIKVQVHSYQGPPFWQLHERELTPDLLNKTNSLFL